MSSIVEKTVLVINCGSSSVKFAIINPNDGHVYLNGIAEYLNADPTLIRLAFVIVALAAGSGILAYFLAALIMPEAQEAAE